MLVVDAEVMETPAFVAVARTEDNDLNPDALAYRALAALPGLRLQRPLDPRSYERQGFLDALRVLALALQEVVVVLDHGVGGTFQGSHALVEIAQPRQRVLFHFD